MTQDNRLGAAYAKAKTLVGMREISGDEDNPAIVKLFADVGHSWVKDDETAWCAAFVGAMLESQELDSTRKLNARSYVDWGQAVDIEDALPGDLVIFWRESPTSWKGHVGFYVSHGDSFVNVLGGNQGNSVSVAQYKRSRLLNVRTLRDETQKLTIKRTPKPTGLAALIAAILRVFGK